MDEFRQQLLRRFFGSPERMSRNKNFHAFKDGRVRSAARLGRLLRSLREDILTRDLDTLRVIHKESHNGHNGVVIELAWDRGRRTSFLTEGELQILLEDEHLAEALGTNRG